MNAMKLIGWQGHSKITILFTNLLCNPKIALEI